jgi:tetratricopeptide (TPR) repeat protein
MFGDATKERNNAITDERIGQLISESRTMLMDGNIEQAVDHLLPIFKTRPDHTESNALVGAILLSVQKFDLAEQFLYSAVNTSQWKNSGAVSNLAQVFMHTDAVPLAARTLRKGLDAVGNDDSTGILSLSFADLAFSVGNYSEAAEWYLMAALKRPASVDIWIKASTVRFPAAGRNYKIAENVLMQALDLNRDSTEVLFNLGLAMHGTGRITEAITFYQEALRMGSTNPEIASTLATALHSIGRFPEALEYYQRAESTQGANAVFLANYAMLLNSMGRAQEGRAMAVRALNVDSNNPDAIRAMRECTAAV